MSCFIGVLGIHWRLRCRRQLWPMLKSHRVNGCRCHRCRPTPREKRRCAPRLWRRNWIFVYVPASRRAVQALIRVPFYRFLLGRIAVLRTRLFQKFPDSYIKKHNTTTITSLFFHTISGNFNALLPSFLQLLYTSLVEVHIADKDLHKRSDVIVTWKMCAT